MKTLENSLSDYFNHFSDLEINQNEVQIPAPTTEKMMVKCVRIPVEIFYAIPTIATKLSRRGAKTKEWMVVSQAIIDFAKKNNIEI